MSQYLSASKESFPGKYYAKHDEINYVGIEFREFTAVVILFGT